MTLRAAVFASGRGSNFQVLAVHAPPGGPDGAPLWQVSLLVSDRADAYALERAATLGVEAAVVNPSEDPDTYPERLLTLLEEARIDLVLLAGYLRLVPATVVRRYSGRMLNLHPALLPAFGGKGMYGRRVHEAVLESSARVSGVTVHFVDEKYDQGPILAQWPVPVFSEDTPEGLAARIHEVEHQLYPLAADRLADALSRESDVLPIPSGGGAHFALSVEPASVGRAIAKSDD